MGSGVLSLLHLERDHGFGWQRGGEAAFGCLEILELGWLDSVGLFEGVVLDPLLHFDDGATADITANVGSAAELFAKIEELVSCLS